jgi:hypothetical protein
MTVKAHLLLARRQFAEARDLAVEAQRILAPNLPKDSWPVAFAMNTQGAALAQLGDYAAAERLLLESRGPLGGAPIPGLADKGRARLADLYTAWGKPDEAYKYRPTG